MKDCGSFLLKDPAITFRTESITCTVRHVFVAGGNTGGAYLPTIDICGLVFLHKDTKVCVFMGL